MKTFLFSFNPTPKPLNPLNPTPKHFHQTLKFDFLIRKNHNFIVLKIKGFRSTLAERRGR